MKLFANDRPIFEVTSGPTVTAIGTIITTVVQPITIRPERIDLVQLTGLPLALTGDPPQVATATLDILAGELLTVPFDLSIVFQVKDADSYAEAELYVNDTFTEHLWPMGHSRANDKETKQEVIIPGALLVEGANILEFVLIKPGTGFIILATAPVFALLPGVASVFSEAGDAFHALANKVQ